MALDPVQADVTRIALAAAGHDFALAGGNALVAHGVLTRPTADVDLFSPLAAGAAQVADAVQAALSDAGYQVTLLAGLSDGNEDFARFRVTRDADSVLLDLARDWRAHPAVELSVGPVLDLEDAITSKAAALVGRGLPRDFIDIAAALDRYPRAELMRLTFARDPGLRVEDFSAAAMQLDRLPDDEFTAYGLAQDDIARLREHFRDWPRSPGRDEPGNQAYLTSRASDQVRPPAAAHDPQRSQPRPQTGPRARLRREPPEHRRDQGSGRDR
jgi:hypothetical protein